MQTDESRPDDDEVDAAPTEEDAPESAQTDTTSMDGEESDAERAERLQKELDDTKDTLLRLQAELDNYRKRIQREQADARRYESFRIVQDILPALDNLDRAMSSAEQSGDFQSLQDGIGMVYRQFLDILKAHSAEPIPADGQPFDPNLHEALSQVPSKEVEPMTIVQVVEPGYKLHDRVVRPSRVIVACAPPEE